MLQDIDNTEKEFIKKVEKIEKTISPPEMALFLTRNLDAILDEMRTEFKKYKVWYLAKLSGLGYQAVRNFVKSHLDTRLKTLHTLAKLYIYLKTNPPSQTDIGRSDEIISDSLNKAAKAIKKED